MFSPHQPDEPPAALRPSQNRRMERALRANDTKSRVIPDLLRSNSRARHGCAKAELLVDPEPVCETSRDTSGPIHRPDLKVYVCSKDTLSAAAYVSEKAPATSQRPASSVKSRPSKPNVAVLNMASALRPGGGFLEGQNSQEEYLCTRTTLYRSLPESFYRLPEVSGIYSPEVLVFRDNQLEANDLSKQNRYYIDVISASMLKIAEAKRTEGCTCGLSWCDRHRELVHRKMKAVLRIAQLKGVKRLILGAWGCGNHGNSVKEVAKSWRKVISGGPRQRKPNPERWEGVEEIIFAIPDKTMQQEFQHTFADVLSPDLPDPPTKPHPITEAEEQQEMARISHLYTSLAQVELELERTTNAKLRKDLRQQRTDLEKELVAGSRSQLAADPPDDDSDSIDAEAEDYVTTGFFASDGETDFYPLDHPYDSDSSAGHENAEPFEFRPPPPGLASPHPEEESQDDLYPVTSESPPNFDPETGWFTGSMDGLSALINARGGLRSCSRGSPGEPEVVRPDSSGLPGIDADALRGYLQRHEGSDVLDY